MKRRTAIVLLGLGTVGTGLASTGQNPANLLSSSGSTDGSTDVDALETEVEQLKAEKANLEEEVAALKSQVDGLQSDRDAYKNWMQDREEIIETLVTQQYQSADNAFKKAMELRDEFVENRDSGKYGMATDKVVEAATQAHAASVDLDTIVTVINEVNPRGQERVINNDGHAMVVASITHAIAQTNWLMYWAGLMPNHYHVDARGDEPTDPMDIPWQADALSNYQQKIQSSEWHDAGAFESALEFNW